MTVMATFVGRQSDHREVAALLERHRVVTLVGPGGVGKTRLATELSRDTGRYQGGVLFTELAGSSDHDDIGGLVAAQHGFGSIESMRLSASTAPTLVVLDNCESALRQAAEVAATLVGDDHRITVLATSRAPLQIYGERIYVVEPLALPHEDLPAAVREAAAARLFIDRAEAAGASWEITDDNLVAIGRLVRQLDGLPLAIELAAARSRMLTPGQLVEHLDRQLDLFEGAGQGATARHPSLRRAIQTSYDPLADDQKAFFRALSIFSAPFDLALAHGVAGVGEGEFDTLDRLTRLVEGSLVDARPTGTGDTTEYRLLDSIRAFGLEHLEEAGETLAVVERYIEAVLAFADAITVEALESFSADVLGRIRDRFIHLSHAIEWCIDQDDSPDRAYRLFVPMYGPTGSRTEVASLGTRMRDAWSQTAPLQAEAFAVLATSIFLRGDSTAARPIAQEAIDHPDGSPLAKMIGHRVLGFIAAQDDEPDTALRELQAAVDLAIPFSESFARELQASWGAVARDPSHSQDALEVLHSVVQAAAANEEPLTVVWASLAMAGHHVLLDDIEGARRAADNALAVCEKTGFPWSVGAAHRMLASVLALQEGWASAAPHFRTALDHTLATGDVEGVVVTLRASASAAQRLGETDLAEGLWRVIPAGRGRPIIAPFFLEEERDLEHRLGTPSVAIHSKLIEESRRLLGPPFGAEEDGDPGTDAPAPQGMVPSGTVTFLFTDVEGSTALWDADEQAMSASLARHDALLREAIEANRGYVFSTAGDSFSAAFGAASDAISAAKEAQAVLGSTAWPGPDLRVRMGLHLGEAELRDGDYFGSVVNISARVSAAAHGGQILMTDAVRAATPTEGHDLGDYTLDGIDTPVRVWQLGEGDFPPLMADAVSDDATPVRFGDCELDLAMRELRRGGERVHVEPQVFDLLALLVQRRGTVVTKEEILDEIWGDRFVSESALTSRIKSARQATGDDGRTQAVIRTAHGHGYSFVAEIEGT